MELDWSARSPHIRSLFRPWQPGEGYTETDLAEEEERLGVRVPKLLRNFYLAWGMRHDLTNRCVYLCRPENLSIRSDALVVYTHWGIPEFWGIRLASLEGANPPIFHGWPKRVPDKDWLLLDDVEWQPTYAQLSDLLDDATYSQALIGGALHGGHCMGDDPDKMPPLKEYQRKWLERQWQQIFIKDVTAPGQRATRSERAYYVRDGQLLAWKARPAAAVQNAAALDEIAWVLQINWFERW